MTLGAHDLALALPDGSMPVHLAAASGHDAALRLLQKLAPGSLRVANNRGLLPAHYAALNGREAALRILHELAPGSLRAANNEGRLPAHSAAHNGHEAALRVLQDRVSTEVTFYFGALSTFLLAYENADAHMICAF